MRLFDPALGPIRWIPHPLWTGLAVLVWLGLACGPSRWGELQGTIQLEGKTNSEGINVFLPGTQYRAVTDANGRVQIVGILPGEYTVVATHEGYHEYRDTVTIEANESTILGPILLAPVYVAAGDLSGFVTLEGKSTHEDIIILLLGTPYSTVTNTTGFFSFEKLPPGTYKLLAMKENWLAAIKDKVEVVDRQETQIPPFQLSLSQTGSPSEPVSAPDLGEYILQGFAFLEGTENHMGIRVTVEDLPGKSVVTNATGAFQITGLDQEPRTLILSYPGYLNESIPNAVPVPATAPDSCGFITLQKAYQPESLGVLQGRVFLAGQTEHANTTVRLEGVSPPVYTDPQGRFKFVGIPAGEYVLIAEHPGYEPQRKGGIEVVANQVIQIPDLTLPVSEEEPEEGVGEIRGTVFLEGENDHGGVTVAVEGTSLSAVSAQDGTFVLPNVPFGAYSLIFTKGGYKNLYLDGVGVEVDQITMLEAVMLEKDIEPPYVVSTFPRDRARQVPIDRFVDVIVKFSERMEGGSVKNAVMIEPPVTFDAYFDRESDLSDFDTLHLRLYQGGPNPIQFKTLYTVGINPSARTPKQVPMAEPYFFSFITDGPLIIRSIPAPGERDFLLTVTQKLMIETNAPVDPGSLDRAFRIRPTPDSEPQYNLIPTETGTQIMIEVDLRPKTRYRLQVTNSLRSLNGMRFSNTPYYLSFRALDVTPQEPPPMPIEVDPRLEIRPRRR
ncbi:MAG: hypothetical protein HPY51_15935 [Candidatus Omnitrophica bacterium]|nr:hypothetical protein [Candidatus Omnitrophota bacterium]